MTQAEKCGFPVGFTLAALLVLLSGCTDDRDDLSVLRPASAGGAPVVYCAEPLPAVAGAVCEVIEGSADLRIAGTILTPDAIYRDGEVLLDDTGLIRFAGCPERRPGDLALDVPSASEVRCPEGIVSPGLVNTHEHLFFSHNPPVPDTGERYSHRNEWRPFIDAPQRTDSLQVLWSELRHVMTGVTSTAGGGSTGPPGVGASLGFLRNLDVANLPLADDHLWDLDTEEPVVIVGDTFPLESPGDYVQVTGDCSEFPQFPNLGRAAFGAVDVYLPHAAEGTNAAARNEFRCLTSGERNGDDALVGPTGIINGIALNAQDGARLAAADAALIWTPRSNIALYGDTAPVTMLDRQGVLLALGTDWAPTGSSTMPRELTCAAQFNDRYLDGHFSDYALWRMVTVDAARTLRVDDRIGALAAGFFGDIAVFDGRGYTNPYRAIFEADASRVALVLRRAFDPAGRTFSPGTYFGSPPLFGDAALVDGLGVGLHSSVAATVGFTGTLCESLTVCGVAKRVCLGAETYWQELVGVLFPASLAGPRRPVSLDELRQANSDSTALFSCGAPAVEPTCTPMRPGEYDGSIGETGGVRDSDGDGVRDADDNCRRVFNPPRVMDEGLQADADGDGRGDRCDPCPLDAAC